MSKHLEVWALRPVIPPVEGDMDKWIGALTSEKVISKIRGAEEKTAILGFIQLFRAISRVWWAKNRTPDGLTAKQAKLRERGGLEWI